MINQVPVDLLVDIIYTMITENLGQEDLADFERDMVALTDGTIIERRRKQALAKMAEQEELLKSIGGG